MSAECTGCSNYLTPAKIVAHEYVAHLVQANGETGLQNEASVSSFHTAHTLEEPMTDDAMALHATIDSLTFETQATNIST